MAENLGNGVSYVVDEVGYDHDMVVFQKGKPPLDTELNLVQQIQNVINKRQMNSLPSGWLSMQDFYTSMTLSNSFYTQNPTGAIPEFAIVDGNVLYIANTGNTTAVNANLIDLGTPPTSGNKVNGVYLEAWRALIDPSINQPGIKPNPLQIIDSVMDIAMYDLNNGWVVGENGLVLITQNGGQTWNVGSIDTKRKLNGVFFISSTIGWTVGDNGVIARTSSGGVRWTILQTTLTENLNSVFAVSQLVGWTVGNAGTILKTTNGVTWLPQISGITQNLNGVYFYDTLTGWAVGDTGRILKTTNGGTTWNVLTSNTTSNLRSVSFYDLNYGWAVGDGGTILRTSDGGLSWVAQTSTTTNDLLDLSIAPTLDVQEVEEEVSSQFTGSNKNFTVMHAPITNGNGKAVTTNNPADVQVYVNGIQVLVDSINGTNGQVILNLAPNHGDTVKVTYYHRCGTGSFSGRIWICGKSGTILYSDNIGATWTGQTSGTGYDFNGISFVDKETGWTAGYFSTIRTTDNAGTTWTAQQSAEVVKEVQRVYYEGNVGTLTYLNDDCIHPDVNIETTKRVQLQYKIRVADNVDPSSYPEAGLGSAGVVGLGPNTTGQYPFENMGTTTGDYGLWRAKCSGTVDGYCWAIPMFFVNRRNSIAYSPVNNTNGENKKGTEPIRPDLLIATNIIDSDILDIRRKVILPPVSELLDENFNSLLSNELNTRLFRNTSGGDKYGTRILQTDRVGGLSANGGEAIGILGTPSLSLVASGGLSSEITIISLSVSDTLTTVPSVPKDLGIPTGALSYPNPSYYSAKYTGSSITSINSKPIPGYFTGIGTATVTFTFSPSTYTDSQYAGLMYQITGAYINSASYSLKYIPTEPKLVKNISGSGQDPFYYHGVLDTVDSNIIEQWASGIPSYTNYSEVYTAKTYTDTDQRNRASTVLVKFNLKISSATSNTLIVDDTIQPDINDSAKYSIWTIHSIKNVTSNFTYKIKNISYVTADKITIESESGFPFVIDTIVEVTAAVESAAGTASIRNGASVNFTPELKKIGSFCHSILSSQTIAPAQNTVTISISNGTLLGVSTTETTTSLTQSYCIINNGIVDTLYPVTVTGYGTGSVTVQITGTVPGGTFYIQLLVLESQITYSSDSGITPDGLLINYYYTPYQSVTDLPDSLTLEMVTKPESIFISNLGTGGGNDGYPYTNPLYHIPVTDTLITTEGYFYNLDALRFNNFKVDSGFAEMPVTIPGNFGRSITLTIPEVDSLQRTYYSVISSDFNFETEALAVAVPRKIFIACIAMVKSSSDYRMLKGEYILVIFSRNALTDKTNYTGFINGTDTVAAVYRLPNKPIVRGI